jgi:CSLREA domain-containing protein
VVGTGVSRKVGVGLVTAALVLAQVLTAFPFGAQRANAAGIYIVTTTVDGGDGLCDASECTLREAIGAANADPGSEIHFGLAVDPPFTITPLVPLPPITAPTTIDGTTQPGFDGGPVIFLDGTDTDGDSSGLVVTGGGTTIRGLAIGGWAFYGIDLQSGGNFVGTNVIGVSPSLTVVGNGRRTTPAGAIYGGIRVQAGANNQIGNSDQPNFIAGNNGQGIEVASTAAETNINNNVVGGLINRSGVGNTFNGIFVAANGTQVIGNTSHFNGTGFGFGADSLIVNGNSFSFNTGVGVLGAGSNSTFTGNTISSNGGAGLFLGFPGSTTRNNQFTDNIVSGNTSSGFFFRGPDGQPTEITDDNRIQGGSITNNGTKGIELAFGANGGVQPPAITDVTSGATFRVAGTAAPNARVQIYADPGDEGETFLGETFANEVDGSWANATWVYPDMTAIATAVKAGTLFLHATQTTSQGTSEFSGAITPLPGIRGIATCDGETLLTGATVELYSGSAFLMATFSDVETAEFFFAGVAPSATYRIRIFSFPIEGPGITVECWVTTTTDGAGSSDVEGGVEIPNHKNHVWPAALDMSDPSKGATQIGDRNWRIDDYIFQQGQSTWFKVPVRPGQRVLVKVTNVPADYSVALFKDIRALFDAQIAALTAGTDEEKLAAIRRLDASVAPDALSPDALSPDELSPDELSPDALSPDALSPDELSPDALSPDELSPDELSPDALSPDALSPDELSPDALSPDALSDAYAGAQTAALIGVSAHVGLSPEQIARNTWDNSGYFYVRVRGHNGAFDASLPFTLEIKVTDVACTGVTLNDTPLTGFTALTGKKTVILTNTAQFPAGTNTTALRATLDTFAARPDVAGAVVDLKDVAGVASAYTIWNGAQDCPAAANIAAKRIRDVISAYRAANPALAYVVLVGGDHVVPFFRIPDQSGLGSEKDYRPAVQDPTASQASLRFGYVLTQDFYGSKAPISRFDHELYVPDLAVGRLVETVADISAMIDAYTATNGVVAPTSALVSGYDFLADAAGFIAAQFQANGLSTDAQLIQPVGEPPTGPNAWTATQLRSKLFGPSTYGILSLNAHFSGNSMLASDYATRLLSSEVSALPASDTRFRNALILSTGCHSGYNIVDREATALTQPIDWAQAFAARGATVVGGTGYQYGDTDFMKYSEKILADVALELRYGTGPVSIGVALTNAKRTYLSSLVSMKGIDEKAMAEATLYGLPMLGYDLPAAGRIARPSTGTPLTPTALTSPGLSAADFSPTYTLTQNTRTLTQLVSGDLSTATYFDAAGNVAVAPGAPVLPQTTDGVGVAGQALRGAVLLSADYTDVPGIQPFTDVATTEVRGAHAQYVTSVFTPVRPFDLNQFVGSNLITTPFQYRSTDGGPTGTGRTITSESFRLYYSNLTDTRALAASPVVYNVELLPDSDPAQVRVNVVIGARGPLTGASALGVQDVFVTYTGETGSLNGHWASLALTRVSSTSEGNGIGFALRYTGLIPRGSTPALDVRALVQAVGGNGLVTWASNDGAYYRIVTETATAADPKIATSLALSLTTSTGTYRSTLPVRARLTTSAGGLGGKVVSFRSGGVRIDATTAADGWASAELPLLAAPGQTALTVGFEEDEDYLGSGAETALTILRAPSRFDAASTTVLSAGSILLGTLMGGTDPRSEPLGGQLVTLTGAGRTVQTFTDGYGRVRLDTLDGFPAGGFSVAIAYEGNDRYLPAGSVSVSVPNTFVTAGGWILTPSGAIGLPAVGKKNNFSINARYKAGETVPSGNFDFKGTESNVTFKSTSFESMSVVGSTAEVQGRGTLNGTSGWSFRVRVTEGSPDTLTVTIWKEGTTTFDAPSYRASNSLGGGNVVIH